MLVDDGLLSRHVYESNLIEQITACPGEPLYDGHLVAARVAARGEIVHPNTLHAILASGVPGLRVCGGKYRPHDVAVGRNPMPRWQKVPMLMEDWFSLVEEYKQTSESIDELAHLLHAWFLSIHPYVDGNGRTARLVWNMLRINRGLPWHIEPAETKHSYYARIRGIETDLFKKTYPKVYP